MRMPDDEPEAGETKGASVTRNDLIIDVGMHDGTDTAFYLAKGFNVVAIEANPGLVRCGSETLRFADQRRTAHAYRLSDRRGERKDNAGGF